ncbi:hypothetical protein MW887_008384 [Aspergillus wentii]|nr:hypothetical protein MW887_008384 [Aspergillus wentii]
MDIFQQDTLRAGLIIFTVVLGALFILYIGSYIGYHKTGRGERPLVVAVGGSLPLLLIRMVYSLLECFGSHAPGSVLVSNPAAEILELFLANMEEIIITILYIATGMALYPGRAGPNSSEGADNRTRKLEYRARRNGL